MLTLLVSAAWFTLVIWVLWRPHRVFLAWRNRRAWRRLTEWNRSDCDWLEDVGVDSAHEHRK